MSSLSSFFALFTAKCIRLLIRSFTKSGGTAAPGLYALKIDPRLIRTLSRSLGKGTIVVAGTNGKTTTSRMIATILKTAGQTYVHNEEGSNLLRGVASALASKSSFDGKVSKDYGLWEIDEATLPLMLREVEPNCIVLTNLFRDQLDRYGEVAKIRTMWQEAFKQLPSSTSLILNADDPSIAHLGHATHNKVTYFGIEHLPIVEQVSTTADANFCAVCSSPLTYEAIYYSHIGKYRCKKCGLERPEPSITASNLRMHESGSMFTVHTPQWIDDIALEIPGIYNIYNALAAIALAVSLRVSKEHIMQSLPQFRSVFGRVERVTIEGKHLQLFLVKNPTGFNEVLHVVTHKEAKYDQIVIGINDNFADGRDISWLWDVDFEHLEGHAHTIIATGVRAYDLVVRLKYANNHKTIAIAENFKDVMKHITHTQSKAPIPVLLTYTAMLAFRKYLVSQGYLKHYLREEVRGERWEAGI